MAGHSRWWQESAPALVAAGYSHVDERCSECCREPSFLTTAHVSRETRPLSPFGGGVKVRLRCDHPGIRVLADMVSGAR